jgi:predicted enzyme related to lactoylglutathione lyase
MPMVCHFILYVRDQSVSTDFYRHLLAQEPALDVPGMTEFHLAPNCILGLMPETGIKRLLGDKIQDPEKSTGVSRAEVYLQVSDPNSYMGRAKMVGAAVLSELSPRNWCHDAGYVLDPDGHVVAFARPIASL